MEVSERLGRARNNQQLTQLEVAQRLHVSRQTISNWETGRSYPDIASLLSLADLYRLSLDSLLKEDAKMIEDVKKKRTRTPRYSSNRHEFPSSGFNRAWHDFSARF
ncbi:helix-turn-helix domain-containing protein [Secundilactobacillus kimchicus]|uniref:helix-turn-helix domain-containing protein n=1 Tax=Secundilactobacillus kimchicus TaxID=528209 RepID=UPI0006D0F3F1|nr:helix-turn-helix transcriptional regulator [Secundilactobacillus kimchicus]